MNLDYNETELKNLMKDFHLLTGIRIVLFDAEGNELLACPEHSCRFCERMKSRRETRHLCSESDRASFSSCQKKNQLILYHCHAGLIEAVAPLSDHNTVIGYMMFGQISDHKTAQELFHSLKANPYLTEEDRLHMKDFVRDIPLKTREQIQAAAKIMETCTFYAILKNTISIRRENFIRNMDRYLMEHLSEDLSVSSLAAAFGICKSKLYQNCSLYYGCGIAEHVRRLRIETAKKLLIESEYSITEISDKVGFSDYNYFCRVFKKEVGIPAKQYRKLASTIHL